MKREFNNEITISQDLQQINADSVSSEGSSENNEAQTNPSPNENNAAQSENRTFDSTQTQLFSTNKDEDAKEQSLKGKRGRKLGQKNKPKVSEVKPSEVKPAEIDLSEYKQVPNESSANAAAAAPTVDISQYVSGALLLIMIDSVFPSMFTLVYPKLKALKDKSSIKMTKEERKELEPIADAAIKQLSLNLNPVEALLISLGLLYGGKIMLLEDTDFDQKKLKAIEEKKKERE